MITQYHSRMPHIHPQGATFFITFCLQNSLPIKIVQQLKQELHANIKQFNKEKSHDKEIKIYNTQKRYFGKLDSSLDKIKTGAMWLKNPKVAQIVVNRLKELEEKGLYHLVCYSIMPNHVHILLDLSKQLSENTEDNMLENNYMPLSNIMKLIKGASARWCNQALNRTGKFWQKDSYDHYVRGERELENIIYYILNNPVKAGFVKEWRDYTFSYLNEDYINPYSTINKHIKINVV